MQRALPLLTCLLAVLPPSTQAQAQTFDVASIKPNSDPGSRLRMQVLPGGNLTATSATLKDLVRFAYGVPDLRVSGAGGWMDSERFDILAKVTGKSEGVSRAESLHMLQALLADRFQLKLHKESKEMPVYILMAGPGGARLTPLVGNPKETTVNNGVAILRATTLSGLAGALTMMLGRVVTDETHREGDYDLALQYTPDTPSPDMSLGPSLTTALKEQLGLRLVSRRAPVEMIAIEHAERPTAN